MKFKEIELNWKIRGKTGTQHEEDKFCEIRKGMSTQDDEDNVRTFFFSFCELNERERTRVKPCEEYLSEMRTLQRFILPTQFTKRV
jgi:hypothetical protein